MGVIIEFLGTHHLISGGVESFQKKNSPLPWRWTKKVAPVRGRKKKKNILVFGANFLWNFQEKKILPWEGDEKKILSWEGDEKKNPPLLGAEKNSTLTQLLTPSWKSNGASLLIILFVVIKQKIKTYT